MDKKLEISEQTCFYFRRIVNNSVMQFCVPKKPNSIYIMILTNLNRNFAAHIEHNVILEKIVDNIIRLWTGLEYTDCYLI